MAKQKEKHRQVLPKVKLQEKEELVFTVKMKFPISEEPVICFSRSLDTELPLLHHVPPDAAAYILESDTNLVKYALFGKVDEVELLDTATEDEKNLYYQLLLKNTQMKKQAQHATNRLGFLRKVVRFLLGLPDEHAPQTEQDIQFDAALKKALSFKKK